MPTGPYHHGDLHRTLLAAAIEAVTETGPAALSLRDLARRAGVSHAAPAHHFKDKAGLFTALAAEGFGLLADELTGAGGDLLAMGEAYVRFAIGHPAHFEVMFRPELYHPADPALTAARDRASEALHSGVTGYSEEPHATTAAWSIAHGFATLWLSGALPRTATARPVLSLLFDRHAAQ